MLAPEPSTVVISRGQLVDAASAAVLLLGAAEVSLALVQALSPPSERAKSAAHEVVRMRFRVVKGNSKTLRIVAQVRLTYCRIV